MVYDNLTLGLFYWLRVYGPGLVAKNVVARIMEVNDYGPASTYKVKVLDSKTGELYELKSCFGYDFTSEINIDEVREMIAILNQKLIDFTEQ